MTYFQVVLYNSNLTNLNNITGDQIGAYFGYSLASGDLDGDGRDDVIIGAPMWTNYEIMGKYETGRVYVVYQGDQVTTISVASKLKIANSKNVYHDNILPNFGNFRTSSKNMLP